MTKRRLSKLLSKDMLAIAIGRDRKASTRDRVVAARTLADYMFGRPKRKTTKRKVTTKKAKKRSGM